MSRVLIVFHSLDRFAGGVETRLSELEINLSKNINREYLLYKDIINLPHIGKINNIPTLTIPKIILKYKFNIKFLAYIFGFINLFYRVYHTRKFLKNNKFDTILAIDDYFALIIILSNLGLNYKIITSTRNSWNKLYDNTMIHLLPDFIYKIILPKLYNKYVSHVHTVSNCIENELKIIYKINNTITIYNLFDIDKVKLFATEKIEYNFKYIINIGHLNHQKNQKDLIQVYKLLKDNYKIKEKLVFIGDGTERENLLKLTQTLKLENDIIFLGKQTNPYKYLSQASLYVSTSLYEGLPGVFIESIILNIPIVSYNFKCGASELAYFTKEKNIDELANLTHKVLVDKDKQTKALRFQQNILKNKLDKNKILNQWITILGINNV